MKENFYISNLTFWKLIFYTIKYYWLWTVRFGHFRAQEEPPQPKQRPFLADILGWHRSLSLLHRPPWPTSTVLVPLWLPFLPISFRMVHFWNSFLGNTIYEEEDCFKWTYCKDCGIYRWVRVCTGLYTFVHFFSNQPIKFKYLVQMYR